MNLSRQQLTLLGIFALFMGPVILVMLMRSSWWQYQPAGMQNQGYLVQPPIHLPLDSKEEFGNKWIMLYTLGQTCDQNCINHITSLRQIHRAAGRNSNHIEIVLLSHIKPTPGLQSRLESIYPEFNIVSDSTGKVLAVLDNVNSDAAVNTGDSSLTHTYILDPMLNIILVYGESNSPSEIHGDIKRLLKWSDQEK